MHPFNRDVGAYIHTANKSHVPAANAAGTRNGTALEIRDTRSIVLTALTGATTGTPDSFTLTYTLQDSLDGSTFVDAQDSGSNKATLVLSAASTAGELDVNLVKYCRQDATHVRFTEVAAFVNGTSPTVLSSATIVRGPGQVLPQ